MKCGKCKSENIVESKFFLGNYFYCIDCKASLDPSDAEWFTEKEIYWNNIKSWIKFIGIVALIIFLFSSI